MQIDGLRHAAVVDSVSSRLDREIWEEQKKHHPGRRPPHMARPVDAESKAFVCRYTYDRNELQAGVSERESASL